MATSTFRSQAREAERAERLLLALLAKSLRIGLAVWIEAFLAALLPRSFKLGRGDVPVGSAFAADGTQVFAVLRGQRLPLQVAPMPFVANTYKR